MRFFTTLFFLFSFTLIGQSQEYYFPERAATWEHKSPKDFKIDNSRLQEAISFAESNEYSGSRDLRIAILKGFEREPFHKILGPTKKRGGPAGLILKNGHIVAHWGDTERVDMTFSVTKSFLSTMAGLAVDDGLITHTNDRVGQYVWDGTFDGNHNSKITWEHLLQQNSAWSGELWGGKDWADRPPKDGDIDDWKFELPKEPGTVMEYNDVRVNVLAYALTHVWRKPMPLVLKENIMDKIGASTTWRWYGYDHAWTEIDGLKMKSVTGGGHSGAGLFINTEDMARFGLLFLNNGKWKKGQIISEDWIKKAIVPSKPNANYGYMWWLNKKGD
ncbi:MAG: serine hydrolase, partial [Maribacter sp.]